ncbi:MAG TPA: hypothetical protein VFD12_00560 [Oligella sp.]|nr:hypothetical protein [Oligella sp.]
MKSVIKMPQSKSTTLGKNIYRSIFLTGIISTLAACATYRDVAPNAPLAEATRIMGQPNYTCERPDGGQHLVWSYQPMGQYIYGANVGADGNLIGSVYSAMTEQNFKRLDSGSWGPQDVLCEFGAPAETQILGLGEKREEVWSYRFKQNNHWHRLLHIYMGRDGQQVTHWHTGPDPLYEDYCLFGIC